MKTDSETERFEETAKLMDYGFNNFSKQELFPAGYQAEGESAIPVAKGKEDQVQVSISEAISLPVQEEEAELYHIQYHFDEENLNEDGELVAPIEAGEVIGEAELVYEGENDYGYITNDASNTIPLVADESVEKSNWFMLTLDAFIKFFAVIFTPVTYLFSG